MPLLPMTPSTPGPSRGLCAIRHGRRGALRSSPKRASGAVNRDARLTGCGKSASRPCKRLRTRSQSAISIRRYFADVAATWDEWRVDVEQLVAAPDGRVAIVMSTHMRGKGSGLQFAERVANVWQFKDEKLWRATLHRNPADALRAAAAPPS